MLLLLGGIYYMMILPLGGIYLFILPQCHERLISLCYYGYYCSYMKCNWAEFICSHYFTTRRNWLVLIILPLGGCKPKSTCVPEVDLYRTWGRGRGGGRGRVIKSYNMNPWPAFLSSFSFILTTDNIMEWLNVCQ